MNDLKTIESAIRRLESMYDCNREVMDADDQGDLLVTIKDLEFMRRKLLHDEHKKNVTAFRDYVLSTMPSEDFTGDEMKAWEDFYELKWSIRFGDQEVTLENAANTWQPIVDMLNDYIEEM